MTRLRITFLSVVVIIVTGLSVTAQTSRVSKVHINGKLLIGYHVGAELPIRIAKEVDLQPDLPFSTKGTHSNL